MVLKPKRTLRVSDDVLSMPKAVKNPESYNISSLSLTFLDCYFIQRMNFLKTRKNITAAEILIEGWKYDSFTAIISESFYSQNPDKVLQIVIEMFSSKQTYD